VVVHEGDNGGTWKVLLAKLEGKTSLGKPRRRWKNTIKTDLKGVEWGCGLDLSGSGQHKWRAVANTIIKLQIPQNSFNF